MKRHPIISFFIGLIASGFALALVYLLFLFLTFDLAGGETLAEMENLRSALLILTIIVAIIAVIIARYFLKTGRKFTAYGISTLPLLALVYVGVFYVNNLNTHTAFDKTIWGQSEWKPFNMAATLAKEDELIGMTEEQVKEMLGQGFEEHDNPETGKGSIIYLVKDNWKLIVYFQEGKVVESEFRLPWLCV